MSHLRLDRHAQTKVELALAQQCARHLREERQQLRRQSQAIAENLFRLPGGEDWVRAPQQAPEGDSR